MGFYPKESICCRGVMSVGLGLLLLIQSDKLLNLWAPCSGPQENADLELLGGGLKESAYQAPGLLGFFLLSPPTHSTRTEVLTENNYLKHGLKSEKVCSEKLCFWLSMLYCLPSPGKMLSLKSHRGLSNRKGNLYVIWNAQYPDSSVLQLRNCYLAWLYFGFDSCASTSHYYTPMKCSGL